MSISWMGLRCGLTKRDTRNLISRWEGIMRRRSRLPTPNMRLPTRGLENAMEVRCKDKDSCQRGDEPELSVPFGGLWDRRVTVQRQGLSLDFVHGRGDGGSRGRGSWSGTARKANYPQKYMSVARVDQRYCMRLSARSRKRRSGSEVCRGTCATPGTPPGCTTPG